MFKKYFSLKFIYKNIIHIILTIIFLIILKDLTNNGLPITHDGLDHIARIANFYNSLSEGIFFPRWAANLNWGYGHPVLMFLYPLPSYLTSLFHLFGFNLTDSFKLFFASSYILSYITMYIFLKKHVNNASSHYGALIYILMPYRIVDLYVRGAIGEHVSFIFIPLVFLGLNYLASSTKFDLKNSYLYILSLSLLILSHNAVLVMFLPLFIIYYIFLIWKNKKYIQLIISTTFYSLISLLSSAFFLFPAYLEGKYTLRDIVTKNDWSQRFVKLSEFISFNWSYGGTSELSKSIGLVGVIFLIILIVYIIFSKKISKLIYLFTLFFIFSIYLMTSYSSYFWSHISILQKFQFPWRFMIVSVFSLSFIIANLFNMITNKLFKKSLIFLLLISIITSIPTFKAKEYKVYNDNFFNGIYSGTTDTGESSPIWSVRFMEKEPDNRIALIDGSATITVNKLSTTKHEYTINSNVDSKIVDNTLYFPGWNVYINGEKSDIQFQNQNFRGLITFNAPKGTNKIDVIFEDTKLRMYSNYITIVTVGLLFIFPIIKYIYENKQ